MFWGFSPFFADEVLSLPLPKCPILTFGRSRPSRRLCKQRNSMPQWAWRYVRSCTSATRRLPSRCVRSCSRCWRCPAKTTKRSISSYLAPPVLHLVLSPLPDFDSGVCKINSFVFCFNLLVPHIVESTGFPHGTAAVRRTDCCGGV